MLICGRSLSRNPVAGQAQRLPQIRIALIAYHRHGLVSHAVGSAVTAGPFTRVKCAGSDTTRAAIDYVKLHSRLHIFTVVAAALYRASRRVLYFCDQRYLAHEIRSFVRPSSVPKFRRKSGHRSETSVPRKAAGFKILRLFYR
jgi:hypothetical protein